MPRRRTGRLRDRAHLDDDRRALARRQRRDRARLAAVARQVLEQVADGLDAERRGGLGGLRRRDLQRALERRRPRPAQRRAEQLLVIELVGGREGGRHAVHDDRPGRSPAADPRLNR